MQAVWVLIVVLIIGALIVSAVKKTKAGTQGNAFAAPWPLTARKPLTPTEQAFFWRLSEALPDHVILAQVNISALAGAPKGKDGKALRNRYNQKSTDYVICDQEFNVIAAVELDDKTHSRQDRIKSDATKEHVFRSAGIKLIRWHAEAQPKGPEIRAAVGLGKSLTPASDAAIQLQAQSPA